MHLSPNIFGHEFGPRTPNPFGLHSGQMRSYGGKMAHNGSWYNQKGERVGWGDLNADDFRAIQAALEPGDGFFVLGESSFWRFVTHVGPIGSMCTTEPTIDNPGLKYIEENFRYFITRDGFFYKARHHSEGPMTFGGLTFQPIKDGDLTLQPD